MSTATASDEPIEQRKVIQIDGSEGASPGQAVARTPSADGSDKSAAALPSASETPTSSKELELTDKIIPKRTKTSLDRQQYETNKGKPIWVTNAHNDKEYLAYLIEDKGDTCTIRWDASNEVERVPRHTIASLFPAEYDAIIQRKDHESSPAALPQSIMEKFSLKPPAKKPPPLGVPVHTNKATSVSQTREQSSTKEKAKNVLAIPISPIETQVHRAARLVAVELEYGAWPEESPGARRKAASALQEFAKTIFLPNLLAHQQDPATASAPDYERVFLSTMLALREVLTQNASRIFSIENVALNDNEVKDDRKDTEPGAKRRKRSSQEEERQYMAQQLATGVVFAAIQSMETPEAESYLQHFMEIVDLYDTGDDEFVSCMQPRNGRHTGVTPNLKTLSGQENVAWRVSFNRARQVHPVVCRSRNGSNISNAIDVPSPNTVFIALVEDQMK